ncbi:MAG: amylo-alpha-1,6-glucosidase [Bacteroidales bacterium]
MNFDKTPLTNLESSLNKEMLSVGKDGSYFCSSIIGCNTRKYHGCLVSPQPQIDNDLHVLLSQIDDVLIQQEQEFNLSVRKYAENIYYPKGHKYILGLEFLPYPKWTYRVGGAVLTKELFISPSTNSLLLKYTLVEAKSKTKLRLRPLLAFRNEHQLTHANKQVCTQTQSVLNGIKCRLYENYSDLFIQFSKKTQFVSCPDWYYGVEYIKELERGYQAHEDLFSLGYLDTEIQLGESVYVAIGTQVFNTAKKIAELFESESKNTIPLDNLENCLRHAAKQFIVRQNDKTEIVAGYPWFGRWGRDTFISLPGLTLTQNDTKTCKAVIDTMLKDLKGPLFPNIGSGDCSAYNSVDAPLWFFWALQQYTYQTQTHTKVWKEYGDKMKMILDGFKEGTVYNIKMLENGLVYAGQEGKALTWMDAVVEGHAITPRIGMPVEINALWYNALMFSLELAQKAKDKNFVDKWKTIAETFPETFKAAFWNKDKAYLADVVSGDFKDFSIRPNQIIAASLPYSPLSNKVSQLVVEQVKQVLLTPRGLRTLAPMDTRYKGVYQGSQAERDEAYHQGTVWVWLLGHYAQAYLKVYGQAGLDHIEKIYMNFENALHEQCVGSIAEIYDGDPPHKGKGAISQAWSVAELLRIKFLINTYKK